MVSVVSDLAFDAKGVAAEFVKARRSAGSFTQYPGPQPKDLDSAYRCQDEAIALWGDSIAGWKVGWIPEPLSQKYGAQRLVGPIFSRSVQRANGDAPSKRPCLPTDSRRSRPNSWCSWRRTPRRMSPSGPPKPRDVSSKRCTSASRSRAARWSTSTISARRWSPAISATTPACCSARKSSTGRRAASNP